MIKLYKNLSLSLILFLIIGSVFAQLNQAQLGEIFKSNLPLCQGEEISRWSNCLGEVSFKDGESYMGEFKNGKFHGQGIALFKNNAGYDGQWKDGMFDGFGTYKYENGGKYVGEWKRDFRNGKGYLEQKNGSKFEGQWKNDVLIGVITATYADGSVFVGTFKDGVPDGQGVKTLKSGVSYSGQWKSGDMDGRGTLTDENGQKLTGVWKKNELIKDESPKPPPIKILTLSCPSDGGDMKGIEFQYEISIENKSIFAVRGTQPSNILITPTVIAFKQGEGAVSINRVTGKFSIVLSGSVLASGTCQSISQAKPKF
jgi:hypothetical protein